MLCFHLIILLAAEAMIVTYTLCLDFAVCLYPAAHMIAGHTADYVNSVLAKVVAGDPKGGLPI